MSENHSQVLALPLREVLRRQWPRFLLGTAVIGLAYARVLGSLACNWYTDENASHGFYVPLIAGYLIWKQKSELARTPVAPANSGLAVALLAAAMLLAGSLASELYTMRASLLLALAGCILFWLGKEALGRLRIPLLYLIFMIPLPAIVINAIALPLKLFVSQMSVAILHLLGVPVLREGNVINLPNLSLEVVEACSGLRSLESLLALSTAYAIVFLRSPASRVVLIVAAVPIAVGTNILRVVGTGLLARQYGAAAAQGFFHEFAGLILFSFALLLLAGLHSCLRRFAP